MIYSPRFVRPAWRVLFALVLVQSSLAHAQWPPAPPIKPLPEDVTGELPPSLKAELIEPGQWRVTFSYRPDGPVESVHLAGSFNAWNPTGRLMTQGEGGDFTADVPLAPGEHLYKFVINSGERWISDPRNPRKLDDGHQGHNSVLQLGRLAAMKTSGAKLGDGQIDAAGLEHLPEMPLYFQPLSGLQVLIRYRALSHDLEKVTIHVKNGGQFEAQLVKEGPLFALYEAHVDVPPPTGRAGPKTLHRLEYAIVISDGSLRVSDATTYTKDFAESQIFKTPSWAANAIWYQIMPDRFRNGSTANDPPNTRPWTSEWFAPSPWEGKDGQTFYKFFVFRRIYGGDFDGVEQKLDYLKDLGVNALYFNPVFEADSHHKYNATNYVHIDDQLGVAGGYAAAAEKEDLLNPKTWTWTESDKRFLAFLKVAKAKGFRVIIDGVFNHVGSKHPAFLDVQKNGKSSRFADWFEVTSWEPFKYNGWGGFGDLPAFKKSATNLASETLKEHIFNVTRRWMDPNGDGKPDDGVDGWRLDVPNEVPLPFWAEWRTVVKSVNPDAYIVGEIWDRADQWLDGRHFDAVMNYEFSRPIIAWIGNKNRGVKVSDLDYRLRELRLAYPEPATFVMQNLVDSHDTDRIASMLNNPDRDYDRMNRVQDDNPNYNNDKPAADVYRRLRLVALTQMTYVGAPMIYYGTEVGMWGADDPTCRKPMLWEDLQPYEKPEQNVVDKELHAYYKQVIAARNRHPALRSGTFTTLATDDDQNTWAFLRSSADEALIVALNAGERDSEIRFQLPAGAPQQWTCVFGGEGAAQASGGAVSLKVPAVGGVVLHAKRK